MRLARFAVLALLAPAPLAAQGVAAEAGNVVYRESAGSPARQLTTSGRDAEPVLSPDGAWVAFVRGASAAPGASAPEGGETSLWIVRADGGGARALVRGRPAEAPERNLTRLRSPRFSPDGATVYFLSAAWATSDAVHAVDLASGEHRFVVPGNGLEVLPAGRWAGHLLVPQHRYFLAGGSYDWTWLFTPEGEEVGAVGEGDASVEAFRREQAAP